MAQQIVIEVPGTKISELEPTSSVQAEDLLPIVQGDETKRAPLEQIANLIKEGLGSAALKDESDFATPALVNETAEASQARDDAQNERIDEVEFKTILAQSGVEASFDSYAAMLAYTPTKANVSVRVNNDADPTKMGTYTWTGTEYKLGTDLVKLLKDWVNTNGLYKPIVVANTSTTLAKDFRIQGIYLFNSATPAIAAGFPEPTAGFLFVNHSGNMVHQKWIPFNSNSEYTRTSSVTAVFPPFQKLITQAALDSRLASELSNYLRIENIDEYTTKPYEIITVSKNLYDESKKQLDVIVGNNGALQAAAGWSCSDFISVTEGEFITISFDESKRQNLGFYAQKGSVGMTAIGYNTSAANPLTVQVPVGAHYLVVNIDSNTITAKNVQIELGQTATAYEPYGIKYQIDTDYLKTNEVKRNLKIQGNNATINGYIENEQISLHLLLTKVNDSGDLTVFNFAADYVNSVLQRDLGDDVAPMRLDGATVGANHGYKKTNLGVANHGKTTADIGSVWTADSKEYVIVDIIDLNNLSLTSRTDNGEAPVTTFTHVSGAINTSSFTATAASMNEQWYPSIRDRKLNCFVDDTRVDLNTDGTYSFKNTVSFLESYSIMKKADIVEWLIANPSQDFANYDAIPCYTVSFAYTFDHECGCTIYFGGVGRKQVALMDQMITQSVQLSSENGTVYNYIPKAIEFTTGGFTYNFQNLEVLASKNPTNAIYLTPARQEAGTNPVDRIVMLNDQVGYATGYLPVLDAAPNVRPNNASNKYLEIRNKTLKLYPRLIDSTSITQINDGDAFAAIAYRKYFKRSEDRTCNYVIRSELGDYLYLDWHVAKTDEVELPSDLIGREFEIVEKSSNVNLLSKFSSNSILVKIDNTKSYGFLVLKFI